MAKIIFFCDAIGQLYNTIAIAQACRNLDHHCTFLLDHSYQDISKSFGFDCKTITTNTSDAAANAWKKLVNSGVSEWKKSPIEQLENYIRPYYELIVESSITSNIPLKQALSDLEFDLICVDDVVLYPAIVQSNKPWVRIISCAETELPVRSPIL